VSSSKLTQTRHSGVAQRQPHANLSHSNYPEMFIVARFPVSSRDEHNGIPGSPAQKMRARPGMTSFIFACE
jgi:hypothetical protein